jgi:LPS export ABC transporter protein LptC
MYGLLSVSMIKNFMQHYNIRAALIAGCFFVSSCENDMREVQAMGKKTIGVEEAKNIESYLSQSGKVKAKLIAPLMLRYQLDTPKVEFPKSLFVNFYNDSLQVESKLSAKYGNYFENENRIFLRDSIVVYNVTGDTLFCNDLYWDQQKGIFYTNKKVIIKKPGGQLLYGKGLVASQDFKSYTIRSVYNSMINIPDSSFVAE